MIKRISISGQIMRARLRAANEEICRFRTLFSAAIHEKHEQIFRTHLNTNFTDLACNMGSSSSYPI